MSPKKNPLKLNPLQLRTLTLFQAMAAIPEMSSRLGEGGEVMLARIPHPHGNHFHLGASVVAASDATGFANASVWAALERKGLIRGSFPYAVTVTADGLAYDTGLADQILHRTDH